MPDCLITLLACQLKLTVQVSNFLMQVHVYLLFLGHLVLKVNHGCCGVGVNFLRAMHWCWDSSVLVPVDTLRTGMGIGWSQKLLIVLVPYGSVLR